ncbi:hypothetical protein ACLOJK_002642 [Asimina triloba]
MSKGGEQRPAEGKQKEETRRRKMVGTNLKAETLSLKEKRDAIELEMNSIISRLTQPGGPGISGSLVDAEASFPIPRCCVLDAPPNWMANCIRSEIDTGIAETYSNSVRTIPFDNLTGSGLVQGFPRADIDIAAVRGDRRRLAVALVLQLYNIEFRRKYLVFAVGILIQFLFSVSDERFYWRLHPSFFIISFSNKRMLVRDMILSEITDGEGSNSQFIRHTDASASLASPGGISENGPGAMDVEPVIRVPFAMIDEIADASPAAEDGLQLGDQIVKFGNVEIGEDLLPRLASEAQLNQGRAVPVVILRQGTVINLPVTPRPWHGRGLLGQEVWIAISKEKATVE